MSSPPCLTVLPAPLRVQLGSGHGRQVVKRRGQDAEQQHQRREHAAEDQRTARHGQGRGIGLAGVGVAHEAQIIIDGDGIEIIDR